MNMDRCVDAVEKATGDLNAAQFAEVMRRVVTRRAITLSGNYFSKPWEGHHEYNRLENELFKVTGKMTEAKP